MDYSPLYIGINIFNYLPKLVTPLENKTLLKSRGRLDGLLNFSTGISKDSGNVGTGQNLKNRAFLHF